MSEIITLSYNELNYAIGKAFTCFFYGNQGMERYMDNERIIELMTIEEKVGLLSGRDVWTTKPNDVLGVPSITLSDDPHGLRKQAGASDHLGLNASVPATCFPTAATVANSWNESLGEEIGRALGEEAAIQGVNVILGPGMNIKRSPLCGRNFEYFSEDPYLTGKVAAAYVRGIQSQGIAACPKHYAANSQELLRMANDSVVDERTLREIYLTAFEIVVKESNNKMIMTSYNLVNGTYANENQFLLQNILRDEWGYKGCVVTDWGGSNDHVAGVKAGSHLEMPGTGGDSDGELLEAIRSGSIGETDIEKRVSELLNLIFDTHAATEKKKGKFMRVDKHHKLAEQAAEDSIVLLKNKGHILPVNPMSAIAVIGDFAKNPRYQGAGSSVVNPTRLDNTLECIKDVPLNFFGYEKGYHRSGAKDIKLKTAAVNLAAKADVVLLYIGLDEISESEGLDRSNMRIPANQIELLEAIYEANKNIVAVLSGGSAIEMPWINNCKGVIHGYLSGQAGARAMLRAITGKVNPSGKLNESYPYEYKDTPTYNYYPGKERTSEYREGPYIGYRYYETAQVPVRFPFGYGLSYTSFDYFDLKVSSEGCSFRLTNTGFVEGAEVVQLYVSCNSSEIFRPKKELKGFVKINLKPGENKNIFIPFDDKTFRYYNIQNSRFEVEEGEYGICIGASSEDIRLKDTIQVQGSKIKKLYSREELPSYFTGNITSISDHEFETLLRRKIPQAYWDRTRPLERNDTISQMFYAKSRAARFAYKIITLIKDSSMKKGKPNLNILFIYNMPFRGLAKMTGGALSMEMVDALLVIINGKFVKGAGLFIKAMKNKSKHKKNMP